MIAMPWALKHLLSARAMYSSEANKKMKRMLRQRKQSNRETVQYKDKSGGRKREMPEEKGLACYKSRC